MEAGAWSRAGPSRPNRRFSTRGDAHEARSGLDRYGNLIIGYDKNEVSTRTGSHNLIVGDLHEYTSYGGIVSGTENTLAGPNATILGGGQNHANFTSAVILGADRGNADGNVVLIGGQRNYGSADAHFGAVIGGIENQVTGPSSVVVAGTLNIAAGGNALACGGNRSRRQQVGRRPADLPGRLQRLRQLSHQNASLPRSRASALRAARPERAAFARSHPAANHARASLAASASKRRLASMRST